MGYMGGGGEQTRVCVVEGNPMFRSGLVRSIEACAGLLVCGDSGDDGDAVRCVAEAQPHVTLVGLSRSGPAASEVLVGLQEAGLQTAVVLVAELTSGTVVQTAILNGARGYLSKDVEVEALCEAIRAAARGDLAICAKAAALLREELRARMTDPSPILSDRETAVMRLVAEGQSNAAIAAHLFISVATVKSHISHAFERLEVSDRTSAAMEAERRGLL